ncbi:pre-rRNA-processing protein esf1, partial [Linderina pennispora]
ASANFFDLRFVPDDMVFDDGPTDEAFRVPEKYEPADFTTQALQHSKVSLTWDADEPSRTKVTRRAFTQDEVENMDFAGLLASSDESSDEEARARARNLLLASNNDSDSDESHADDGENEMEITFTPGLSEAAAEKLESKSKVDDSHDNETTIERFRRVKKERREKWKESKKNKTSDLVSDDELDTETAADPFFTYSDDETPAKTKKVRESKSERKQRQEKEKKEREELELLLDGAESGRKHFDMAEIIKSEKHKGKKKGKKGQKRAEVDDGFKVDTSDPRFSALYDSHNFAIDPNNPNFKKTKAMKELLDESRKRHKSSYN